MRTTRIALLTIAGTALAANAAVTIELVDPTTGVSSGWAVTIFDEEFVDIVTDAVSIDNDRVVIQKFAEFTKIDEFTGRPQPINIDFRQIADDADTVSQIVITDERIINNTGQDWIGFSFLLINHGQATWNTAQTNPNIGPFTTQVYSNNNTILTVGGGVLGDGETWTPGLDDGGFVIDVDLAADAPVNFTLKELPGVPAPGALALAALGGLMTARRRRA